MSAALAIRGGMVFDGSGDPGRVADVAISEGVVQEIGPNLHARDELDATGCVVAPGFIDIHTHYDAQVFWDPALRPSSYHGVTTVVAGNCGFGIAPTRPEHHDVIVQTLENVEDMDAASLTAGIVWDFQTYPEYMELVHRRGTVLNFACYLGHSRAPPLRHGGRGLRARRHRRRDRRNVPDSGGSHRQRVRPGSRPASPTPIAGWMENPSPAVSRRETR